MLTKKELREELRKLFKSIDKSIRRLEASIASVQNKSLNSIEVKLDKFIAILERLEKKQRILEKKIEAIEEYFDPHPRN